MYLHPRIVTTAVKSILSPAINQRWQSLEGLAIFKLFISENNCLLPHKLPIATSISTGQMKNIMIQYHHTLHQKYTGSLAWKMMC